MQITWFHAVSALEMRRNARKLHETPDFPSCRSKQQAKMIEIHGEEYLKEADRDKDEMARAGIETSQVSGILTKQDLEIMKTSRLVAIQK